ncbi:translocation/assembly module TamB domain-containing protein [Acidovorax sp. LjRoot66]|uniref:translocation/assembly module TamB domain-containing protein n=1 Tax=Acidovorax sp. LjRoot66 TaxID=3342334 RepID=UPI003ECCE1F4
MSARNPPSSATANRSPDFSAGSSAPPPPPRRRRSWLRLLAWLVLGLLALVLAVGGGAWWWAGSNTSLAMALARAAQYLPADQKLESRDVSGSLRAGGNIGWLRWSSPAMVVEVDGARIGWQLAPLLSRKVELGEVHAARVRITPQATAPSSTEPLKPLEQLVLPVQVAVPFKVDSLEWAGSPEQQTSLAGKPAVQAQNLAGDYRYDGTEHHLKVDNVELAQGRYSARVKLQAQAPMAIDATVDGTVQTTPPGGGNPLQVGAHATVQGTLATAAAQLELAARLQPVAVAAQVAASSAPAPVAAPRKNAPATPAKASAPTEPMQADVQATILPWVPQPLKQAHATLKALDLAALWPQAPRTLLHGTVQVDPVAATAAASAAPAPSAPASTPTSPAAAPSLAGVGWNIEADLRNDLPGPWDTKHLPLAALQARAGFDGARWDVPAATATIGTGKAAGTIALKGQFTPATGAAEGQAELRNLRPDALHTALAAAPLGGRITAQGQADQAVRFTADIRATGAAPAQAPAQAAGKKGAPLLRINTFTAQGQYLAQAGGGTVQLDRLLLDALQAKVEATQLRVAIGEQSAQGQLRATVPGATASANGQIAPTKGAGELQLQLSDAERTQAWLASLPGMADATKGATAKGQAQINARWTGGWQTAASQIEALAAGKALPASGKDANNFTLQARVNAPQLDVALPPGKGAAGGAAPMSNIQLRGVNAELSGSLAQATLALDGEARTGTQRATVRTRLSGGMGGANEWQAQVTELRLQAQDTQLPGPWAVQLAEPVTVKLRMGAATPAPAATASGTTTATSAALSVQASAGQARITGPVPGTATLRWQPITYAGGGGSPLRLQTQGSLQGLPMAWVDALGGGSDAAGKPAQPLLARLGLAGNIVFDGQWNVDTSNGPLRASASVRRASGDLRILAVDSAAITTVQSSGQGTGAGSPKATVTEEPGSGSNAGVRQAELSLEAEGDALRAKLVWASDRAGEVDATASTRLTLGSTLAQTTLAPDAPLAGTLRARLPDVGVWSALAPPGWRVRGTLDANATLSGTRAAPRWAGTLGADELAVRSILDGVDLQGGRLRAALNGNQLDITEFRLRGGSGSKARIPGYSGNRTAAPQDGGSLTGTGRVTWGDAAANNNSGMSGLGMSFQAEAKALQVLGRADRQVSVSGKVQAQLQQGQFSVRGQLTTDRATIILPDETAPSLGSDVVVRSAAKDREAQAKAQAVAKATQAAAQPATGTTPTTAKPPDIAITLNLGSDFALQGQGITTRLTGELDIRSSAVPGAPPRVIGEVRTEQGRYRAWGQVLDVETGLIRFSGPYNNPSLDILALRPNISVRAGVQVSGSALAPRVRLYSDPDLPDAEKLSWVVLGRDAAAGGAEAAVLQQAALALLGRKGGGGTANVASRLGLDEIGFKGPGTGDDATGAALTFGKRLSTDLYVTYERSLSGTLGTLYIFYDLSRRLTLRGQTGAQSAVDIIYTLKYD